MHVSTREIIAIIKNMIKGFQQRNLSGMAQQTAYNLLFALGPLLISLMALAGIITRQVNAGQPQPAKPVVTWVNDHLPHEAAAFFEQPLEKALTTSPTFLLSVGGIITLWGAKGAMAALMRGLNDAYGVEEDRSWPVVQLVAIGLTLAAGLLLGAASIIFVLGTSVGNTMANAVGLGSAWSTFSYWARWPVLAVGLVLVVALLHRYAQVYDAPFRSFLPGAVFTVVAIVISAIGMQFYFNHFSSYNELYGAFGSVLVFIFWLYVIGLVILLGGVLNLAIIKTRAADEERRKAQASIPPS
ncbi:MAG: YihY/virulence factor BrkB family protein [Thermomicrobiales bacterium]